MFLCLTILILFFVVIRNHAEVKDIHGFPTSFLDHLEQARKEKDRRLVRSYDVKDDGTFKKFSHKKTAHVNYIIMCVLVMWLT